MIKPIFSLFSILIISALHGQDHIPTIKFGNQEWTNYALNVSTYRNGDTIPEVKNGKEWGELTTGAWCYYRNDSKFGDHFSGKLYNWYAVNDSRGLLLPNGFHIPSKEEWEILGKYIGNDKMSIPNWISGIRDSKFNRFIELNESCYLWSTTEVNDSKAWGHHIFIGYSFQPSLKLNKNDGLSIRCIKD